MHRFGLQGFWQAWPTVTYPTAIEARRCGRSRLALVRTRTDRCSGEEWGSAAEGGDWGRKRFSRHSRRTTSSLRTDVSITVGFCVAGLARVSDPHETTERTWA